jgi:hypothetical protein
VPTNKNRIHAFQQLFICASQVSSLFSDVCVFTCVHTVHQACTYALMTHQAQQEPVKPPVLAFSDSHAVYVRALSSSDDEVAQVLKHEHRMWRDDVYTHNPNIFASCDIITSVLSPHMHLVARAMVVHRTALQSLSSTLSCCNAFKNLVGAGVCPLMQSYLCGVQPHNSVMLTQKRSLPAHPVLRLDVLYGVKRSQEARRVEVSNMFDSSDCRKRLR